jgi:hypothetical protein
LGVEELPEIYSIVKILLTRKQQWDTHVARQGTRTDFFLEKSFETRGDRKGLGEIGCQDGMWVEFDLGY